MKIRIVNLKLSVHVLSKCQRNCTELKHIIAYYNAFVVNVKIDVVEKSVASVVCSKCKVNCAELRYDSCSNVIIMNVRSVYNEDSLVRCYTV
ncbi:hypothetical protein EDL79_00765 [Ehrlichia ruminantium]|uniref:Uncharacterized protein n=1 Tax=Ehrlichia ruminantium TaxID=779 RepID=A0AAE6UJB8_EHRRU|nr:hypothetical protein [Ehrlichia ruminantium]QGR02224.1 hypothetical protein EDL81_00765 [Ehrlichia ruminantium]QGR03146.1 hypothetical protein EDL80_00765 [Ehrlichia ruminantium]QGR04071.1 hypothetical protein EDL79_00765 [Ehrlichia ruminantium]